MTVTSFEFNNVPCCSLCLQHKVKEIPNLFACYVPRLLSKSSADATDVGLPSFGSFSADRKKLFQIQKEIQ
ncbi:CLUMA_CG013036, isoform A [Clunio marinus]|uniref:CLUMA_CG013036, isoform A n=1 Tax=Clunio marinus TaxID=568069 RepID=A0A1J1IHP8_9DIPT|nr:CLUMA_CG013036, isoform A [Clunio marinus]